MKDYVYEFEINNLKEIPPEASSDENVDDDAIFADHIDHFPLEGVLKEFSNLTELNLSLDPLNSKSGTFFEWSPRDVRSIRKGLYGLKSLKVLRVRRCRMDVDTTRAFAECLFKLDEIEECEVSHCDLDDGGAMIMAYVLLENERLKRMILRDDRFGDEGIRALSYAFWKGKCPIETIGMVSENF
jgi:hypothetical protein